MKRFLGALIALCAILCPAAFPQSRVGGRAIASAYSGWSARLVSSVGSGPAVITLDNCIYQVPGGSDIFAIAINTPLYVGGENSETVTPSAVSKPVVSTGASNGYTCSASVTFASAHQAGAYVSYGDGGVGAAVNDLKSGIVVLDPAWYSTVAVTSLPGGKATVALSDERIGPATSYCWGGSAYAVCSTSTGVPPGCSINTGVLTCAAFSGDPTEPDSGLEIAENITGTLSCLTCARFIINSGNVKLSIYHGPYLSITNPSLRTELGTYVVDAGDNNATIKLSSAGPATLPAIDSNFPNGFKVALQNDYSGVITVNSTSPTLIESSTSTTINLFEIITFESDGTTWRVAGFSPPRVAGAFEVWGDTTGSQGRPAFHTLVAGNIPALDAAKVTTGVFAAARIPALGQYCGTTTTCSATLVTTAQEVYGHATLIAGTATVTAISPAFTATATVECFANDRTDATKTANAVIASTSSVLLTGNSTDVIGFHCIGAH